ncbi:hypothetical protein GCM10010302_74970 [Streptomyces polychromogenes]|uniref:Uncharacterized protein n=1 Tax=Streptomyces polychromogenes TaxID=67342 RepID=A0ABP3FUP5_9ACTN
MLRESLFDRLDEVVGGGAGGLQLNQEGEHLLAKRVLDQWRLLYPLGPEDLAEQLGVGCDASLTTGSLERGL